MGLPLARKMNPSYTADEIIPIVDANKRLSSDFINSMSMFDFNSVDPLSVISKIEVPVLLIIGDKEKMSIVSTETANKAAQANSKVQIVHLKGASHNIRRTRFDGYMPALKQFLKEVYSEWSKVNKLSLEWPLKICLSRACLINMEGSYKLGTCYMLLSDKFTKIRLVVYILGEDIATYGTQGAIDDIQKSFSEVAGSGFAWTGI